MKSIETVIKSVLGGKAQLLCDGAVRVEMQFVKIRKWINLRPEKPELKKTLMLLNLHQYNNYFPNGKSYHLLNTKIYI